MIVGKGMSRAAEQLGLGESLEDGSGQTEVVFGGDFEIHGRARNDGHGLAEALDELGVVGCGLIAAASVRVDKELPAEDLGCLRFPQCLARHCFADSFVIDALERGGDGGGENRGAGLFGSFKNGVDPGFGQTRAGRVMNGYEIDLRTDAGQGGLHRIAPFGAASDDFDAEHGAVAAELFGEVILVFGRNDNQRLLDIAAVRQLLGSVHPDGATIERSKRLLVERVAEAGALASSREDDRERSHNAIPPGSAWNTGANGNKKAGARAKRPARNTGRIFDRFSEGVKFERAV